MHRELNLKYIIALFREHFLVGLGFETYKSLNFGENVIEGAKVNVGMEVVR